LPARLLTDAPSDRRSLPAPSAALPTSSLAEQNALYAQGSLARDRHDGAGALAAWSSFLQQFPQGVLAPEAATGILSVLVDEGREREALAAADDYLGRFPADGRAAQVAYIRGNLLREKLGRTSDALAAYRQALALATSPRVRDDALFAVGACQRMLGYTAAARETFKQYQTEFPTGAHAGELSRWLSETR
jgi:TolA-binding protein